MRQLGVGQRDDILDGAVQPGTQQALVIRVDRARQGELHRFQQIAGFILAVHDVEQQVAERVHHR